MENFGTESRKRELKIMKYIYENGNCSVHDVSTSFVDIFRYMIAIEDLITNDLIYEHNFSKDEHVYKFTDKTKKMILTKSISLV